MIGRFFTPKTAYSKGIKKPHSIYTPKGKRSYLTMTRSFPGGCVIKVRGNSIDPIVNKQDLLKALPQNLRLRDCISLIVDPAILIPHDHESYELFTPLTHLAAFISNGSASEITINEKTILSKIQAGFPKEISDTENLEHGKIKAQNYELNASYQRGSFFVNRLFNMPKQKYEYRYFIFLAIDTIKNDPNLYIQTLEKEIAEYIKIDTIYHRQNNSCVHPILVIFGKLDKKMYESAVPQAVAVDVMKSLLNDFRVAYAKFLSIASYTGLDETPYKASIKFEEHFENDSEDESLTGNTTNIFGMKK